MRRAINTMVEAVTAVNVDNSRSVFSHSPAISAATTECSGPYSGMRAPSRPSDHSQIASPGSLLIFASSSFPSKARVPASSCSRLTSRRHLSLLELLVEPLLLVVRMTGELSVKNLLLAGINAAGDPTQQHRHANPTLQIVYKSNIRRDCAQPIDAPIITTSTPNPGRKQKPDMIKPTADLMRPGDFYSRRKNSMSTSLNRRMAEIGP